MLISHLVLLLSNNIRSNIYNNVSNSPRKKLRNKLYNKFCNKLRDKLCNKLRPYKLCLYKLRPASKLNKNLRSKNLCKNLYKQPQSIKHLKFFKLPYFKLYL